MTDSPTARRHHVSFWRFGIVNCFFMGNFTEIFVSVFCIGRGILYPRFENVDTMAPHAGGQGGF